jgi:hypothetical protein
MKFLCSPWNAAASQYDVPILMSKRMIGVQAGRGVSGRRNLSSREKDSPEGFEPNFLDVLGSEDSSHAPWMITLLALTITIVVTSP